MGRKKTLPQQMGDERRREVEWNMLDNAATATTSASQSTPAPDPAPAPGSLTIVGDNDPTLQQELEAAEEEMEWETGRRALSGPVHRPRTQATTSVPVLNGHGLGAEKIRDIVPESVQQFFRRLEIRAQLEELLRWSAGVPAYSKDHPYSQQLKSEWHWEVGKFSVQLLDHDALPVDPMCHLSHIQQCMLYFAFNDNSSHIIYYKVYDKETAEESQAQVVEKRKNNTRFSQRQKAVVQDHLGLYWYIRTECSDVWSLFQNLKQSGKKKFQLMFGDFDSTGRQLEVTMYGLKDSLQKLAHPSQGFPLRPVNYVLLSAMDHFYKLGPWPKTDCTNSKHDFQELYRGMKSLQNSQKFSLDIDVQHPSLKPRLRPYQQDAVRWMLKQERFGEEDKSDLTEGDDLHPMYTEVVSGCGKTLYYNRQGGSIVLERPTKVVPPPGGILADEMGLGKTVEVLCCMLLHPRPPFPQPARLPTLMEMELDPEEEDSDSTWAPVSGTNSSTLRADHAGDTKPTDIPLKRVDSESSSLSSVPSEVVSYEVTGDHSYISSMPADGGGGTLSVATLGQMVSPQPGGAAASDVAGEPGEEFKSPLKPEFGKDLMEESTGRSADEAQPDAGSESQPRCEEQPARSGRKKKKSPAASKGKKRKLQPAAGEKTRKSPTKAPDQENGAGSGTPIKEKKRTRLSRYFKYIPHDEYQQFMTPSPLIVPKKQLFECVCGKGEAESVRTARSSRKQKHVVMCTVCGTSQHAECMHYDLEDPFRGPYKCPHCHYNGDPIPSGATLIVSPFSISHQWTDEIKKHIREKTIKVFRHSKKKNSPVKTEKDLEGKEMSLSVSAAVQH